MEDKLKEWEKLYHLKNLQIVGYRGGYPMIQFDRDESMSVSHMSEKEIKKVVRSAELGGGIELGVAYNFRKTAFLFVHPDIIVICGHEFVLSRILEKLF